MADEFGDALGGYLELLIERDDTLGESVRLASDGGGGRSRSRVRHAAIVGICVWVRGRRAPRGSDVPMPRLPRASFRDASTTTYPASTAARAEHAPYLRAPSITQKSCATPLVRGPAHDTARDRTAVEAGNCAALTISSVGQARIDTA